MQFDADDLDMILDAAGEDVVIKLSGSAIATIQGKFRKNYLDVSPFESSTGILKPVVICKTSDLAGITNNHSFVIQGAEYKFDGKPEELPSGFTHIKLGLKK